MVTHCPHGHPVLASSDCLKCIAEHDALMATIPAGAKFRPHSSRFWRFDVLDDGETLVVTNTPRHVSSSSAIGHSGFRLNRGLARALLDGLLHACEQIEQTQAPADDDLIPILDAVRERRFADVVTMVVRGAQDDGDDKLALAMGAMFAACAERFPAQFGGYALARTTLEPSARTCKACHVSMFRVECQGFSSEACARCGEWYANAKKKAALPTPIATERRPCGCVYVDGRREEMCDACFRAAARCNCNDEDASPFAGCPVHRD